MTPRLLAMAALAGLAACGARAPRIDVPPAAPEARIPIAFASVEVLDVDLPAYAREPEIYRREGLALTRAEGVWADDPGREVTLDLVRTLGLVTNATVAPEPWPFESRAEARLDVRVTEIVADAAGAFVLGGQYFAASQDGSNRDRARGFRIAVPLAPDAGPAATAIARAQATALLAEQIAAEGLR